MPPRRDAPRSRPAARSSATRAGETRPGGASRGRPRVKDQPASGSGGSTRPTGGVAFIEPRVVPIEKATDLGSVQVLKHGNLFLLTDRYPHASPLEGEDEVSA